MFLTVTPVLFRRAVGKIQQTTKSAPYVVGTSVFDIVALGWLPRGVSEGKLCFVNYPILQVMEFLLESSLVELI